MTTPHLTLVGEPAASAARNDFITFLSGANADYIAELYARYVSNPADVDESWQNFFAALNDDEHEVLKELRGASWRPGHPTRVVGVNDPDAPVASKPKKTEDRPAAAQPQAAAAPVAIITPHDKVADAWRTYGHFAASLDPLGMTPPPGHPELQANPKMQAIYGGTTGFEYMHLTDPAQRSWWQDRIENGAITFSAAEKKKILGDITRAEGLEEFLAKKFVGVKRFGLEGSESCMAAIEQILERGAQLGVDEICLGMAHRGRLNVLTNTCGKPFTKLLAEFQGAAPNPEGVPGSSDVKYHMGYSNDRDVAGRRIHVSLSPNPSHLEFVGAAVEGKVRAKQFQRSGRTLPYDAQVLKQVLPLVLHGDAAFAGQGIVAEILMMSELQGYKTGGTIHIITNNQIGFTTGTDDARSTPYASDMAKMINIPVIHVNGDDAEAVVRAARMALEWRQQFARDVVLDIIGYRRHGHNEGDEPAFTQPLMYAKIKTHPTTRAIYAEQLVRDGALTKGDVTALVDDFNATLEEAFKATSTYKANKADWLEGAWSGLKAATADASPEDPTYIDAVTTATAVPLEKLKDIGEHLGAVPATIDVNNKIARVLAARKAAIASGDGIDWGTGEALAFGSLLAEGFPVRLSGEDVERGTFAHRHAVLNCQKTGQKYTPLNHLQEGQQAKIEIVNSLLSEAAVLGFEYGFSAAEPNTLTIWEAQFGDFANGAQVLIDQFIASAEAKWLRMCGLVLLLPHGYEGQGPEHSSARLERWLQLCAEDNMQVCNITTPANLFHVLRRQLHRPFRKPLIIMSPKSLLRHKLAVSKLDDFGPGSSFRKVIGDASTTLKDVKNVRRVVLCTGKVYYDLVQARDDKKIADVAIVRVEQMYPFPHLTLKEQLALYPKAEVVWCQEEPQNQGAWTFMDRRIEKVLAELQHKAGRPRYVGRTSAAAPACGQLSRHTAEQTALVDEALS
ncbi:MAG: 2-oxoglutarate dehydrogenase E1 component [Bdellovibrionales bacterium]